MSEHQGDGDLRERLAALADRWERFDCVAQPGAIPAHVDVPDDFEAGIHDAARTLRALLDSDRIPPGERGDQTGGAR